MCDLYITCALPVYDLCITYVLPVHYLCMTYVLPVHYLYMTCVLQLYVRQAVPRGAAVWHPTPVCVLLDTLAMTAADVGNILILVFLI